MPLSSAKAAISRLWARRWVRRVSYVLVGGAAVVGGATWFLDQPFVYQWLVRQADGALRKETGLGLSVGKVDFHPLLGTLTLRNVAVGGDLLTLARLDLQADPGSLFGRHPHVMALRLDQPHIRITRANLAQIHLAPRPPRQGPLPQLTLDHLSIQGGVVEIPAPFSGIPAAWFHVEATGTGTGPNRLRFALTMPQCAVHGPRGWERGRVDLKGDLAESRLQLDEGYFRLGESQIRMRGHLTPSAAARPMGFEASLSGVLELAQMYHWAVGPSRPPLAGDLDFTASLAGTPAAPRWTFTGDAQELHPALRTLRPGSLTLQAGGMGTRAANARVRWHSSQGFLEAEGRWSKGHSARMVLQARSLDLDALGRDLRIPSLLGTRATLTAECEAPREPADFGRLGRWTATGRAAFTQAGQPAGGLRFALQQGGLSLEDVALNLPDVGFQGQLQARFGRSRLASMQAQGTAQVDAARVADALRAWNVVDLDMSGETQAQAQVGWTPKQGVELKGSVQVENPRWHGAVADHLDAGVEIHGTELRVQDIKVAKGQGRGGGSLWLTWGPVPKGAPQIDMCYTASRLPVAEGLRAADVKGADGRDLPLDGTGSGWARIHGPFDHLLMEGQAQVESGTVYGLRIPAASADFAMDLDTLRLRLGDVRIAASPEQLGLPGRPPEGPLALTGSADMDLTGWTWRVDLGGRLDSSLLGFPGPRFHARADARLLGPITAPFGPLDLPEGRIRVDHGSVFLLGRRVDGLGADFDLARGHFTGHLVAQGMPRPILALEAHTQGTGIAGSLGLRIAPDTAPTAALARSLTENLLQDMTADAEASGTWTPALGLQWHGRIRRLEGTFPAFELHQTAPSTLAGTASGTRLDLALAGTERGAPVNGPAAAIRITGTAPFGMTAPMAIRAAGNADLGHIKAILDRVMEVDEYSVLSDLKVQGSSRFDLLLHGTYREPLMDGWLRLSHGQMRLQRYQGVEDLDAEFLLKDRSISIPADHPMTGILARGKLSASGGLTWRPGGLDHYDIQASLGNFQLLDVPEGMDLRGSLDASLQGNEDGGFLRGRLQADHLGYQAEVKLSDLILRSALGESGGLTGLDPEDPLNHIRLSLNLDLRTPWSFDTNLLKLEGKTEGRFMVRGTLAHPVPQGTLVFTPGGRLTNIFPAGDMVVDSGSLDFTGDSDRIDPIISMRGSVTSIPGYTVNLDIHGTLGNLDIVPSSTPTLRQDEIVAILINPGIASSVGTGATTSTQGTLTSGLASASAGVLSTLAFAPFQDQLRRTLGLDRVNVAVRTSSLGTTETDVTLGKSINLFGQRSAFVVSHQKSAELNITSGQVEWRFGGYVLQLGVSQSGQSGINPSGEIRHTWSPR